MYVRIKPKAKPGVPMVRLGSVVVLNSGGPRMTVAEVSEDGKRVLCRWQDGGATSGASFPVECVRKVD